MTRTHRTSARILGAAATRALPLFALALATGALQAKEGAPRSGAQALERFEGASQKLKGSYSLDALAKLGVTHVAVEKMAWCGYCTGKTTVIANGRRYEVPVPDMAHAGYKSGTTLIELHGTSVQVSLSRLPQTESEARDHLRAISGALGTVALRMEQQLKDVRYRQSGQID